MTLVRRAGGAISCLTLAALALCGCASTPESVATDNYGGMPPDYQGQDWLDARSPVVHWLEHGESVSVTTLGSSGCPAILTRVSASDSQTVAIEFEEGMAYPNQACPDDLGPWTHEFDLPPEVTGTPVTVTVVVDRQPQPSATLD